MLGGPEGPLPRARSRITSHFWLERLNALRNGLAHALFPENLKKSKPTWKGKNVFSIEVLKAMQEDVDEVATFFGGP